MVLTLQFPDPQVSVDPYWVNEALYVAAEFDEDEEAALGLAAAGAALVVEAAAWLLVEGKHWLYQVLLETQVYPDTQVVPPVKPCPPH